MDPSNDAIAHIRKRPGMYIGNVGASGLEHLVYELVANGIDLHLAGRATQVVVRLSSSDAITVSDDGPGLPYDEMTPSGTSLAEQWLTRHHDSPTADGHAPHAHMNPNGIGLVVVTALSSTLTVTTHRGGRKWMQQFKRGRATGRPICEASTGQGTQLSFAPDEEIFQARTPDRGRLRRRLFEAAHLFPGLMVGMDDERFHAPGGLADYAAFEAGCLADTFHDFSQERRFHVRAEIEGMIIEAAASGVAKECQWRTWCNGTPTLQHGSHRDGFRDALRKVKWRPAVAMLHVIMTAPRFSGPTRNKLAAEAVRSVVRSVVGKALATS